MDINSEQYYLGIIKYINDVTHTGRCKIHVFGLTDDIPEETLPWFVPASSTIFSANGAGSLSVPKVGTVVKVKFADTNIYSGEYYAVENIDPALAAEIEDDYENTQVVMYDSVAKIAIIYQPMSGLKIFYNGAMVLLDPNGNIQLKHQNNTNVIEINENEINITTASTVDSQTGEVHSSNSTARINIASENEINLSAPTVNILSNNIKLGKGADNHIAIAERVENALKELASAIIAKTPQGPPTLAANTWSHIRSTTITGN